MEEVSRARRHYPAQVGKQPFRNPLAQAALVAADSESTLSYLSGTSGAAMIAVEVAAPPLHTLKARWS